MDKQDVTLLKDRQKLTVRELLRRYNIIVTFIFMVIFAAIVTKGKFFAWTNVLNIIDRASIIGMVALGQGLVILMGQIDLSVNSIMDLSFTSVAVLAVSGVPYGAAIAIALAIGAVIGFVNGILLVKTKIPSWLITLSTMMIVGAIALSWSGTTEIRFEEMQVYINNLFGMNIETARYFTGSVWLIFGLLFAFLLGKTRFGMNIFMVGGGTKAARLSGIRVKFVQVSVYIISGIMASIAGIFLAYRVGSLNPTSAEVFQLYSIAAVVLGGANIFGGEGSIFGTFFGAVVLAIFSNVLNIMQVNIYIQNAIMGFMLILLVFVISALSNKRSS